MHKNTNIVFTTLAETNLKIIKSTIRFD